MHDFPRPFKPVRLSAWSMSILCGFAVTGNLSGCGKNEKIPTTADRLAAVQQKQETIPDFYLPRKTVDYMSDLKSLKDAPARNDRSDPAPTSARAEPAKPVGSPPQAQESKVATAPETIIALATPQTAPSTAPAPAPAPNALAPSASAPPSSVVASAAPTARPAPKEELVPAVSVISRVQPEFPRDALRAGIESGSVRARLTISASGEVTDVAILQAQPPRVFDRSVKAALGRWRFNTGANGRTFDTDVGFKAAN